MKGAEMCLCLNRARKIQALSRLLTAKRDEDVPRSGNQASTSGETVKDKGIDKGKEKVTHVIPLRACLHDATFVAGW